MSAVRVRVSETGRLSLPADLRRAVGLEHGGDVIVELDGRNIRIHTIDEVVTQAQALTARLLAGKRGKSVDSFLAERRVEAERE